MDFSFIEDDAVRNTAIENFKAHQETTKGQTQSMIDEAISGLKTKNSELLNEKKQIQQALKNFDGLDPEKAKEALAFLESNADAQLIKDGKIEELLDRKTSSLRTEYETKVEELTETLLGAQTASQSYKSKYESKLLDDALTQAAVKAKVLPSAIKDVLLHGKNVFSVAEDGSIEARDKNGKIVKTKTDLVLNTSNWLEENMTSSPHWWGNSESGDLNPGGDGDDNYEAALRKAAASGDNKKYRELRDKRKSRK